jgi:hypothetical protein
VLMTGEESWIPYYHGETWEHVWEHVKKNGLHGSLGESIILKWCDHICAKVFLTSKSLDQANSTRDSTGIALGSSCEEHDIKNVKSTFRLFQSHGIIEQNTADLVQIVWYVSDMCYQKQHPKTIALWSPCPWWPLFSGAQPVYVEVGWKVAKWLANGPHGIGRQGLHCGSWGRPAGSWPATWPHGHCVCIVCAWLRQRNRKGQSG